MELWELVARESIRDLVARYNANGDTGRADHVVALFGPDAVMELKSRDGSPSKIHTGPAEIRTIFTGAAERWGSAAASRGVPGYIRHNTSTLQIDLIDQNNAKARCYYNVNMPHGLDHWGRYIDEYATYDGKWMFKRRAVTTDGTVSDGVAPPPASLT